MEHNTIYCGDCLEIMRTFPDESIDLIYLDPPYNTGRDFGEFNDTWPSHEAYLEFMRVRLVEMRRLLKSTGSIYLHVDPTESHYLKVMMDLIFGRGNFKNEIIWCYSNSGRSKTAFAQKHDVILAYGKTKDRYFKAPRIDVSEENLKQYPLVEEETGRRYRNASRGKNGVYKEYAEKLIEDWWVDLPALGGRNKNERLGYPTQKPEALLERIISASCPSGGTVLDPFIGSGTTCAVAFKKGMNYVGIDKSDRAINIANRRIEDARKECTQTKLQVS